MAPTSCSVTSTERTASTKETDRPLGAVVGVLNPVLEMIEKSATHPGVAIDHVIESFRNELWDTYTTGEGIEPELSAQFIPLEDALTGPALVHGEPQRTTGGHRVAMGLGLAGKALLVTGECLSAGKLGFPAMEAPCE